MVILKYRVEPHCRLSYGLDRVEPHCTICRLSYGWGGRKGNGDPIPKI